MTDADREKWDLKYSRGLNKTSPSPLVKDFYALASCGNALDIACGTGRNSLFLSKKGFNVDAVDISTIATENLKKKAPQINVVCQDLDTFKIPKNHYDVILNVRFFDRRLFPSIQNGLKSGGLLIFESFLGDKRPEYCVKPNELIHVFHQQFHIVYYHEKENEPDDKFEQTVFFAGIKKEI